MIKDSTWVHLRVPFSFRLAPVFFFALSQMNDPFSWNALLMFILLHFFLYPASNGYNSYFDKDEDSIAGVEVPPPVTDELYYVSLVLDAIALVVSAIWVNSAFFIFAFVYGLISKLYSHPAIRLKAMPIFGWLIIGFFQGYLVFMGVQGGDRSTHPWAFLFDPRLHFAGVLSSLMPLGIYPLTQVYQHKEDKRRGDITISILLGIKGTFIISMVIFALSAIGYLIFFNMYYTHSRMVSFIYALFGIPVLGYFTNWFGLVLRNEKAADFKHTMKMNLVGSSCMNVFYIWFALYQKSL